MLRKVEAVLLAKPKLEKVVIQGLLGYANLLCCIFEGVPHEVAILEDSIVELPPQRDLLDDLLDGSFLGAFVTLFSYFPERILKIITLNY